MREPQTDINKLQFTVRKRTVLYARTSTDDTARDSLSSQIEVCEQFANEQGYTIIERLSEDVKGVSGGDKSAPALNRALEMAQAGLFDVLVIRDVKRYSRDVYKAMDFESRFFDCGIDIEYAWNQELNGLPRKGTGFVMRFLQYWMSEEDRKHIVSKLYKSRVNAVARKKSVMVHGRAPYGYKIVEKKLPDKSKRTELEINEDEAKWVRKIFEWYVFDGLSLRAIQLRLTDMCITRPSAVRNILGRNIKRTPYQWRHGSIRTILSRETYMGKWHYGKSNSNRKRRLRNSIIADELEQDVIVLDVPPIVSEDVFKAAQGRLEANRQRTQKKSKHKYLLRGRTECKLCRYSCRCVSRTEKNKWYHSYQCSVKQRGVVADLEYCELPSFRRDIVDRDVWDWLKKLMNDDEELKKGFAEYVERQKHAIEPLQAELKRIEGNLVELNEQLIKHAQAVTILKDMGSTHTVDALKTEIMHTENLIDRNNIEKGKIQAKLQKYQTSINVITDFDGFVLKVRHGIKEAEGNFEKQLEIIQILDVRLKFTIENGQPVYYPSCVFRAERTEDKPIVYLGQSSLNCR